MVQDLDDEQLRSLFAPGAVTESPLSWERWTQELVEVLARMVCGRASGRDLVPAEVYKHGGIYSAMAIADVAHVAASGGAPRDWKGGLMCPIPRKATMALSVSNSRGVLCSSHAGKAYAKVLRRQALPHFVDLVGDYQSGGIPHGGTEGPTMAVKAFLALAAANRMSAAVVFMDFRAAFYSVLTEEALGSILSSAGRSHALGAVGMLPAEITAFEQTFLAQPPLLQQHGLSGPWSAALAHWHRRCFCIARRHQGCRPPCRRPSW